GNLQELNITTGEPTFTFCFLEGGISIWDSFTDPSTSLNSTANTWDYCHVNSMEKDALGNYLSSTRHTHTLYYLLHRGEFWTDFLASRWSTFTGEGTYFSWQHDARWRTRRLSVYDNAATSWAAWASESIQSRGLLIEINFENSTAAIITSFDSPGGKTLLSSSQGNFQMLSKASYTTSHGGNGQLPVFVEYSGDGTPLRVLHYGVDEAQGYRVFKNSWVGTPVTAPDAAIQDNIVYVSWNGATEVSQWSL
ncbi:ASST-domain-containing protein, partial [Mycena crocata]